MAHAGRIRRNDQILLPPDIRQSVKKHLIPALGHVRIGELTTDMIRNFLDSLDEKGLAPSTIRAIYRILRATVQYALREGAIRKNLCKKLRFPAEERAEQRVLTKQEQQCLRKAAENENNLPARLGLYTGMRLGEVCVHRWSDVNREQNTISIRRTVQRIVRTHGNGKKTALVTGTPKSLHSRRVLPVPDFIMQRLRSMEQTQIDSYIFG